MEPGRPGRQRAPDCIRRQKRRELDARRSKCRIRIGGHLERWCRLKEQLGFALHSQLAQFLLDRYSSHGCVWRPGEPEPGLLHADALQRLVVLSHGHGQECGFVPDVKPPAPGSTSQLVWECVAGHSFSWGVPGAAGDRTPTTSHHGEEQQDSGCSSPPVTGRRRSLRRAGPATEAGSAKGEAEVEGADGSPVGDGDQREEPGAGRDDGGDGNAAPKVPAETGTMGKDHGSTVVPEEKAEQGAEPQEEEEEEDEDFAEDNDLTYTDDLRDENYHPSLDSDSEPPRRQSQTKARKKPVKEEQLPKEPSPTSSSPSEEKSGRVSCKRRARPCDEDVAQIGPKRIRKAAKREILLCDFEGCGKIFSNRQYLNHHKKYQHVHQKTFTCSEPSCGKSFNFKKHLKEHEKLHSDKRDYICEFCARSFRTSSNLIIHRRIHTGEKPLHCVFSQVRDLRLHLPPKSLPQLAHEETRRRLLLPVLLRPLRQEVREERQRHRPQKQKSPRSARGNPPNRGGPTADGTVPTAELQRGDEGAPGGTRNVGRGTLGDAGARGHLGERRSKGGDPIGWISGGDRGGSGRAPRPGDGRRWLVAGLNLQFLAKVGTRDEDGTLTDPPRGTWAAACPGAKNTRDSQGRGKKKKIPVSPPKPKFPSSSRLSRLRRCEEGTRKSSIKTCFLCKSGFPPRTPATSGKKEVEK
ncbi:zinc finger protein 692 isoform 2-T2 [Alca torda]